MKKITLASIGVVAAASAVYAPTAAAQATQTNICTNASASAAGSAITITTGGFVKTSFTPKCSANVYLTGYDNSTYYGVGAVSTKGKNIFMGSTGGGGVVASGSCAATGCTSANAASAATSAPAS